ncbi:iron-sulfur cluster assembly scaffold protein [Qipengyuania gaetbuli]|uniref:iron-sulfur cluster assembly scaffold protein n=1 Tax=Qipengyuania gaetbuli TaxID=266952 RepID=UPI001CD79E23|nr:iron-sulfur cluster assembly scaffold protein [Qipengyuania gaetbuli]MCA0908806.1 iron-sulfur cluster assembly scaffold protein [Qipengyuania gaetbuli]
MSAAAGGALYSPALLSLAVELARYPYNPDAPLQGESRSRSCGSTLSLSADPAFTAPGLKVTACAVGQAACAIFARHCGDAGRDRLMAMPSDIEDWLSGNGPLPEWPDLEMLVPAKEYPGRHGAILLPWRAAVDALGKAGDAR